MDARTSPGVPSQDGDRGPTGAQTAAVPGRRLSRRGFVSGAGVAAGATLVAGLPGGTAAAAPATSLVPPGLPRPGSRRVGFVLSHEQFPTQDLVRFAAHAEQAGFADVWASDHTQPWQANEGHAMFPWLTLALAGARTSRLGYGSGVTCPTYRHHPSQVAQAFASLGSLTPGRVFLGVGTGEAVNELASTGRFDRYPVRAQRLVEAVTLIRRLWTGERTTFTGRYYRTTELKLYDLPPQPVPIYIAASGPKSAYLAGRYGDGWVTGAQEFMTPSLRAAFARGAHAAGRDPDHMPKLVETFVVVGGRAEAEYAAERWRFTVDPWGDLVYVPDPRRIQQLAEQRWSLRQVYTRWPVSTDPAVHLRAVRAVLAGGGTPFIHSGQQDQQRVIDFYGRHVLPHV